MKTIFEGDQLRIDVLNGYVFMSHLGAIGTGVSTPEMRRACIAFLEYSETEGLLPCPVCGGKELQYSISLDDDGDTYHGVICLKCGITGPQMCVKHSAMRAWNLLPRNQEVNL